MNWRVVPYRIKKTKIRRNKLTRAVVLFRRECTMSLSVSLEELLDIRGSLLHVTETEAVLLQLLRHLSPYQIRGNVTILHFIFSLFFPRRLC